MDLPALQHILRIECGLEPDRPLVVGVSGGPDSLCLLDILHQMGYSLVVAHFDHQLRPDSGLDAARVGSLAQSHGLPFVLGSLDVAAFARERRLSIEEAARIDGCTQGQAFRKVIMPLAAPAVFTTAILAFIASWNEFLIASQLSNDATQPVTVAIASFTGSQPHQEPYTAVMAAGTIVTIPLVIMVLLFQRQIVAGLTAGAVK